MYVHMLLLRKMLTYHIS